MDEDVSAIAADNNVNINNPAAKSFASGLSIVNPYQQQITDLTGQLSDITKKEREDLTKLRKDIDQDKWMQLANFGFSILAQPGGQTLLEAVGKGAKESQLVSNLSKLNDKQRALALNASQLDRRELQDKLGLTKTQADMYYKSRDLDLKSTQLDNELKKLDILEAKYLAEGKSDAIVNQIKARQQLLAEEQFILKARTDLATRYRLGKDDIEAAKDQQESFFSNEGAVFNYFSDSMKKDLEKKGYVGVTAIEEMKKIPTSVFISVYNAHQTSKDKGNLGVFYNALAEQLPPKPK